MSYARGTVIIIRDRVPFVNTEFQKCGYYFKTPENFPDLRDYEPLCGGWRNRVQAGEPCADIKKHLTQMDEMSPGFCPAAVRPCKRFAEQNLGAGRIHSARSFYKRTGIHKKRSQSKRLRSLFMERATRLELASGHPTNCLQQFAGTLRRPPGL